MAQTPEEEASQRLSELESKWLDGTITPEEEREYAGWYNKGQEEPVEIPADFAVSREAHERRIWERIQPAIAGRAPTRRIIRVLRWGMSAAAAVILVVATTWWWRRPAGNILPLAKVNNPAWHNDVLPGRIGATLTLAEGRTVDLDSAGGGLLAREGGTEVNQDKGSLSYQMVTRGAALLYNTLATHRGQLYPLTLSDGTRVWLNAESTIRFPVAFVGGDRVVEISGEAYFEVAKDPARPFRVKANGMEVAVLGTSFDIDAYAGEGVMRATLLEGAVRVNGGAVLKPGDQARVTSGGELHIAGDVDVDGVIAWKNGEFHWDHADIGAVLRQVQRWYDIDVVYEGQPTTDRFQGDIPRNFTLTELLQALSYNRVHFTLEGRKLTVLP